MCRPHRRDLTSMFMTIGDADTLCHPQLFRPVTFESQLAHFHDRPSVPVPSWLHPHTLQPKKFGQVVWRAGSHSRVSSFISSSPSRVGPSASRVSLRRIACRSLGYSGELHNGRGRGTVEICTVAEVVYRRANIIENSPGGRPHRSGTLQV